MRKNQPKNSNYYININEERRVRLDDIMQRFYSINNNIKSVM